MIEFNGRQISDADVWRAKGMAAFYKMRGWQVLASRVDEKRPLFQFKDYWEKPLDFDPFDSSKWLVTKAPHPPVTTNLQLMLGRHWGLMAIDLDGDEAQDVWPTLGQCPRTWITHSGGGGRHVWFRIPKDLQSPLPAAFLWKGSASHSGVERLCDRSLLMVPPSLHPQHPDRRYRFLDGHAPTSRGLSLPAMAPQWLLRMKPIAPPKAKTPPRRSTTPWVSANPTGRQYELEQVQEVIPDIIGLVESWGVRFDGSPNGIWHPCHAFDRRDEKPSAAVSSNLGFYVDKGSGRRLTILELGVGLGVAPTAQEVLRQLGDRYVR